MALDLTLVNDLFNGLGTVVTNMIEFSNRGNQFINSDESRINSFNCDKTNEVFELAQRCGWKLICNMHTYLFFDTGFCPKCYYYDGTPMNYNRFTKKLVNNLVKGAGCDNPEINRVARRIFENYPNY